MMFLITKGNYSCEVAILKTDKIDFELQSFFAIIRVNSNNLFTLLRLYLN